MSTTKTRSDCPRRTFVCCTRVLLFVPLLLDRVDVIKSDVCVPVFDDSSFENDPLHSAIGHRSRRCVRCRYVRCEAVRKKRSCAHGGAVRASAVSGRNVDNGFRKTITYEFLKKKFRQKRQTVKVFNVIFAQLAGLASDATEYSVGNTFAFGAPSSGLARPWHNTR